MFKKLESAVKIQTIHRMKLIVFSINGYKILTADTSATSFLTDCFIDTSKVNN
jgi:hypothetical protein